MNRTASWVALATLVAALAAGPVMAGNASDDADWDGAVGLIASRGPTYMGAADTRLRAVPGFYLRYGRISVTTTGGFVTRHNEQVDRGLTADLVQRRDFRVSLSARFDGGRDADADPALAGLPDLKPTVRARLAAVKRYPGGWRLSAGLSPDLLGRGGGTLFDASVAHEWTLIPDVQATASVGLFGADRRYMRSYFGITPEQSATTGLPAYVPAAGLRDVSIGLGLRAQLGPHWIGLAGLGSTHLLGDARHSPLTRKVTSIGFSGGLAWQF